MAVDRPLQVEPAAHRPGGGERLVDRGNIDRGLAGRFHHQYLPDEISYEPGVLDEELVTELEAPGHKVREMDYEYGNMQLIIIDKTTGEIDVASDERGIGSAQVLH